MGRMKKMTLSVLFLTCITLASLALAQVRIAFVPQIQGIPYYVAMEEGGNAAAEQFGAQYTQQGPTSTNAADQLRIFESFINQRYDVIVVSPVEVQSLRPAITRARSMGINVMTSDADAPESDRQVFVAQALDQDLGYTVMDELVKRMGEDAKVAIISDAPTIQSLNNWIAAIRERAETTYPNVEIVSVQHTDGTTARAYQYATDAMTANPDLDAIIGIASTTCPGVAQAVEDAGRIGEVITTGYCSPNTVRNYVKSGAMPFSVLWSPYDLGYLTVWAGVQLAEGRDFADMDEEIMVPGLENAATYLEDENILLLGPPAVFTEENIDDFDF